MIPVFVAIDTGDYQEAHDLLHLLGDHVEVKFGLEFIFAHGLHRCNDLADVGATRRRQRFIDAKPHDIPATVAGAIRSIITVSQPDFISLHTCDGPEPLIAAVNMVNDCETRGYRRPKLLGVTILTSIAHVDLDVLDERMDHAFHSGLDGLICSAHEADDFWSVYADDDQLPPDRRNGKNWPDAFLMVPGIHSSGNPHGDQKRVATPRQAMDNGASAIVIGREIRNSPDPLATTLAIIQSLT
jgi:orotidine-5'-phosphate decarboxylase